VNPTTKRLTAASDESGTTASCLYRASLDALRSYESASERGRPYPPDDESAAQYLAEAQVYATLAVAARP
jgi:hypothetical protein